MILAASYLKGKLNSQESRRLGTRGLASNLFENWKWDPWLGGGDSGAPQKSKNGCSDKTEAGSSFHSSFGVCALTRNEKNKLVSFLRPGQQRPAFSYCFSAT